MAHTYDLSSTLSPNWTAMWDLAWFGIPASDPKPGPDWTYGNWDLANFHEINPAAYPGVPYATHDPAACAPYYGFGDHRQVASYFRPLVGPYSSSGQDAESRAKRDLDLGLLRRPSDPRARLDAWIVELYTLGYTSQAGYAGGDAGYDAVADYRWQALLSAMERATAAGLASCVTGALNLSRVFTPPQTPDPYPTTQAKMDATVADLVTIVDAILASAAGLQIGGRALLFVWVGNDVLFTPGELETVFETARTTTGNDFYVVAPRNSGATTPLAWADGIHPWSGNNEWALAVGGTTRAKSADWTAKRHDPWIAQLPSYPGRVVMGSVFPGFEDWAKGFGQDLDRDIPRSEDLVLGQFDYFGSAPGLTGYLAQTWNDFPEGSNWEPHVSTAAAELEWLTEGFASLFGESLVAAETAALRAMWTGYGVSRACTPPSAGGGPRMSGPRHESPTYSPSRNSPTAGKGA